MWKTPNLLIAGLWISTYPLLTLISTSDSTLVIVFELSESSKLVDMSATLVNPLSVTILDSFVMFLF